MANLFFDVLPPEIREVIYGIRLSDALTRNYYRRVAQKVALGHLVLKIMRQYWTYNYNHIGYPGYNPSDNMVRYVIEKCSKVITTSDDGVWWISQLIRPIEQGLIIYANLNEDSNNVSRLNDNYTRTEYAVDHLIETLGCHRNPNRISSLS